MRNHFAFVKKKPLIGVDHMAGHLLSVFLEEDQPQFPYIGLIVSGGSSSLFLVEDHTSFTHLGRTRDDAAGEAFDKVAKLLGLPYPGGPIVSKKACLGNPEAISFPRAWLEKESLDFSFSGLKTAVLNYCNREKQKNIDIHIADVCSSFQEAVVDVLVEKTLLAAKQYRVKNIVMGGGVSANPRLREKMAARCQEEKRELHVPRAEFCTDNGAMIALAASYKFQKGPLLGYDEDVYSRSLLA